MHDGYLDLIEQGYRDMLALDDNAHRKNRLAYFLAVEKKEAKKQCGQMVKSYWQWWTSMAPLHCKEIREGRTDFKVCHRLGKLASVKLEELFEPVRQAKRVA